MSKIVLDTDGVILDFSTHYINFAEKILDKKINPNMTKYPLKDLLQVSEKEADYVWESFNRMNEWEKIQPLPDIEKAIKIIKEYQLEVYIVTSIDPEHQKARKRNLNQIGLFPKEIICVGANHGHKNKIITEINPIAFADDRLDHLERSTDVNHLVWIDQKQEQIIEFNNYHSKVSSLYEWTLEFLPDIMNRKSFKNENNKKRSHISRI